MLIIKAPGAARTPPSMLVAAVMDERLAPGDWVRNPNAPEWGLGQVQSVIGDRVTANFENAGKQLINAAVVNLSRISSQLARRDDDLV